MTASARAQLISTWISKLFAGFGPAPDRIRMGVYCDRLAAFDPEDVRDAVDLVLNGVPRAHVPSVPELSQIVRDVSRQRRDASSIGLSSGLADEPLDDGLTDGREAWRRQSIRWRESSGLDVPEWLSTGALDGLRLAPERRVAPAARLTECPFARATREVRPDDLDPMYVPDPGIGDRLRRLREAREDAHRAAGVDDALVPWAALNDLVHDAAVGEHARRVRAAWIRAARSNAGVA